MNRIIKRLAVPLSAAAVLGTAGFAYMANTNFTGPNSASSGLGTVGAYTVLNVGYETHPLSSGDRAIDAITVTLDAAANPANVSVYTNEPGGFYNVCAATDSPINKVFRCTIPSGPNAVLSKVGALTGVTVSAAS